MRMLHRLGGRIPLWPIDPAPRSGPLLAEIYTSLAARRAGVPGGHSKIRDGAALDNALAALGSRPAGLSGPISDHASDALLTRSAERRVGKGCVSTCRSRGSPDH